ncbi:MAG TPA: TraB/GumN family protein [Allosphingosinicella sp.]|jgi:hypothetical protein|uniref:TraB/GumN family protein n=1 Tax=Allosphingosinicella sp. TaxID=2823234 RepID=UPI002F28C3BD
MKKLLCTAACLALGLATSALAAPTPALPDVDPALWVVKDKDTTVYLFGTVHGLDGKSDWFNDEVKAAFDKSGEVYLEAILPDNPAELQPIMMKHGMDPAGKSLGSKLTPDVKAKLEKVGPELGLPASAVLGSPMEPWMLNLTIGALAAMKAGLNPEFGADKQILKSARAAGKKVGELEGAEFQFSLFDKVPEALQVKQLGQTLDQMAQFKPLLTAMVGHWNKGDAEGLGKLLNQSAEQMPEFYKMVLTDRNATWAEWIDKRMDQPGTVFVAVGAGHLAGRDSVQSMLKTKGLRAKRVR